MLLNTEIKLAEFLSGPLSNIKQQKSAVDLDIFCDQ